jgi:hypothetical protein
MSPLEQKLAAALARAVKYESDKFGGYKLLGNRYQLPLWFQGAVEALAEFEEMNRPRVNY